jgi:hypothetical protein
MPNLECEFDIVVHCCIYLVYLSRLYFFRNAIPLPQYPAFPPSKSSRPYAPYELEQMRQHARGLVSSLLYLVFKVNVRKHLHIKCLVAFLGTTMAALIVSRRGHVEDNIP